MLRRAIRLVTAGDRLMAGQLLHTLRTRLPDHPEVLRWSGIQHANQGEWAAAAQCLASSVALRPDDFAVLLQLAAVQNHAAAFDEARLALRAAAPHAATAEQCLALGMECDHQGHIEDALAAVERALALEPGQPVALLQRARCLKALGQAAASAADCRALIARGQFVARAWFSLLDLKTVPLFGGEFVQLQRTASLAGQTGQPAEDRLLLDFALGKALEDAGQHAEALAVFERANRQARSTHPWDANQFSAHVDAVMAAFAKPGPAPAQGPARAQGAELVFLVGLPRSGTTLFEQVLASHSRVEGSSELPYLQNVIDEESHRRSLPFPAWVGSAAEADWTRLGQRYLRLSERWRARRPVSTDKLPANWLLAGAALAMLPGARVVDCRRDAVETCWSCYKQLFGPGQVGFAYSFETLAAYWRDYLRLSAFWARRHPEGFRLQSYEALVADPEGACGANRVRRCRLGRLHRQCLFHGALQHRRLLHQRRHRCDRNGVIRRL